MKTERTSYKDRSITTSYDPDAKTWSYTMFTHVQDDINTPLYPGAKEESGFETREAALTAAKKWADTRWCDCPLCDSASETGCTNEATEQVGDVWLCPGCASSVAATRGLRAPELTKEQLAQIASHESDDAEEDADTQHVCEKAGCANPATNTVAWFGEVASWRCVDHGGVMLAPASDAEKAERVAHARPFALDPLDALDDEGGSTMIEFADLMQHFDNRPGPGVAEHAVLTVGDEGVTFCPLEQASAVWDALEAKHLHPCSLGVLRYEDVTGKYIGMTYDTHTNHTVEHLTELDGRLSKMWAKWVANSMKGAV